MRSEPDPPTPAAALPPVAAAVVPGEVVPGAVAPAVTAALADPAPPVYRPDARYVLLLGLMAALPAFSTDMYLPSLPDVARDLHTTATGAQLTMTAMMLGGAVGQLVVGPISDRFGRRRPVLIGVTLHVLTSLACAAAPAIGLLVGLRAAQGFFNASATVVAMAFIRDRFVGADASRLMSRLMLVIGVSPLFAPSVGGFIAGQWGWRSVFLALALFGLVLWVAVWSRLPETLPPAARRAGGVRAALAGYGRLLRDRHFVALALIPGLTSAVLMSYVVGSPFVYREGFGLTNAQFGLMFAANGVGLVAGAQVNAALVRRVAPIRILRVAQPVLALLTLVLLALAVSRVGGLWALLAVQALALAMINFAPPNASALALTRYGRMAGTAAAVLGAFQAGVGGLVSPLSGLLGSDARAMALVMASAAVLGVVVLLVGTPAYRRGSAWTVTPR